MVANEEWRAVFPEAKVYHVSTTASDHCLVSLLVEKKDTSETYIEKVLFQGNVDLQRKM